MKGRYRFAHRNQTEIKAIWGKHDDQIRLNRPISRLDQKSDTGLGDLRAVQKTGRGTRTANKFLIVVPPASRPVQIFRPSTQRRLSGAVEMSAERGTDKHTLSLICSK